jgi:hypothetical protein
MNKPESAKDFKNILATICEIKANPPLIKGQSAYSDQIFDFAICALFGMIFTERVISETDKTNRENNNNCIKSMIKLGTTLYTEAMDEYHNTESIEDAEKINKNIVDFESTLQDILKGRKNN